MDMAFLMRSQRLLDGRKAARLDHELLKAALAASQVRPCASGGQSDGKAIGEEPLVELFTGGAEWRQAAMRQRGCFNRAEAGRDRNGA